MNKTLFVFTSGVAVGAAATWGMVFHIGVYNDRDKVHPVIKGLIWMGSKSASRGFDPDKVDWGA